MRDPYEAAEAAHAEAPPAYALRAAITAALIAERKRTIAYWLCRARHRLIWFGGWERVNCGGWQLRRWGRWLDPYPLSILGRLTFYGWGLQCRLPGTIFVWSWHGARRAYFSPDGTPRSATRWITGKEG